MEKITELDTNSDTLNKENMKKVLPLLKPQKTWNGKTPLSSDVNILILGTNLKRNAFMHAHTHYLLLIKLDLVQKL